MNLSNKPNYREWLASARERLNYTQEQVATESGIARTTYASIENGDRNPSVPKAKKIAAVLNVDWTLFFEEKVRETSHRQITA